VHRVRLQLCTQ